ncbi:MAG: protein-disulfide reductase DsbD family protein [Chloroflexi bacterium]|nr:protein-disulfide reductase DsbD family protein [Chloroflexota bacterium]
MRETAETIIRGDLGEWLDLGSYPSADSGASVRATLGGHDLKPFQRVDLLVHIDLPEGQHAYGEPVPEGFIPVSVVVTGPEQLRVETPLLPPTRQLFVAGVDHTLPVFGGDLEVRIPLSYRNPDAQAGDSVPIAVEVRYQACDDQVCYLPAQERLEMELPVGANLRRERP